MDYYWWSLLVITHILGISLFLFLDRIQKLTFFFSWGLSSGFLFALTSHESTFAPDQKITIISSIGISAAFILGIKILIIGSFN